MDEFTSLLRKTEYEVQHFSDAKNNEKNTINILTAVNKRMLDSPSK